MQSLILFSLNNQYFLRYSKKRFFKIPLHNVKAISFQSCTNVFFAQYSTNEQSPQL